MAEVVFRGATKRFDGHTAVNHLDLAVDDGELLVLLGPSGCGKTTALRMVAGLEDPDEGEIAIGGRVVNDVEAKDRDVAMVFQSYALYPHLSVARNIEFPLRQRRLSAEDRRRLVHETAASLGLADLLDRKPRQLSGGQRQRVALARAIVRQPQAFLMDEPLSNLDAALRLHTRADIVALQRRLGTTTLYVTHDQVEAMTMGHRIALMDGGTVQQVDTPQVLYDRPVNAFVARFVGSPGMNVVPATLDEGGREPTAVLPGGQIALDDATSAAARAEREIAIGIRPEHLVLSEAPAASPSHAPPSLVAGSIAATVLIVEVLGAEVHVLCQLADGTHVVVRQDAASSRPAQGESVTLAAVRGTLHVFSALSGRRLGP